MSRALRFDENLPIFQNSLLEMCLLDVDFQFLAKGLHVAQVNQAKMSNHQSESSLV